MCALLLLTPAFVCLSITHPSTHPRRYGVAKSPLPSSSVPGGAKGTKGTKGRSNKERGRGRGRGRDGGGGLDGINLGRENAAVIRAEARAAAVVLARAQAEATALANVEVSAHNPIAHRASIQRRVRDIEYHLFSLSSLFSLLSSLSLFSLSRITLSQYILARASFIYLYIYIYIILGCR